MAGIQKPVYAMIICDGTVYDNNKKSLNVTAGEIVKVIQHVGSIAIIRPYNQRSMYSINGNYLNFNIPQDEKNFFVAFGTRRLIS